MRTFRRIGIDNLGLITAGVTFYIFLALVPAIIATVASYGMIADQVTLASHVDFLQGYLPDQSIDWIAQEINRLRVFQQQGLSIAFTASVVLSLWAMNNAVLALFGAMNIAYGEIEKRSTLGLYLRCFAFTLLAIIFGIMMVGLIVLVPLLTPLVIEDAIQGLGFPVKMPVLFCVVALSAMAIYRVGPSRRPARWRWIATGAVLAAIGWIAASTLLSWYITNIANYARMYGSLGTIVALMFWLYISVYIFLLGAWLNSEIEHQTVVDTTVGPEQPLGQRGAYVADTVG
ncbi:MAG: YihY/virulence factor BrkB family protein [Pseudomonadota bacterium]